MHTMEWLGAFFALITAGVASLGTISEPVVRREALSAYTINAALHPCEVSAALFELSGIEPCMKPLRVSCHEGGPSPRPSQEGMVVWSVLFTAKPVADNLVRLSGTVVHTDVDHSPRGLVSSFEFFARPAKEYEVAVRALDGTRLLKLAALPTEG